MAVSYIHGRDTAVSEQAVTLGEVYRLLKAVDAKVDALDKRMDTESHSLRNKIGVHETAIALLKDRSSTVRTVSLGGLLAIWSTFLAWLFNK